MFTQKVFFWKYEEWRYSKDFLDWDSFRKMEPFLSWVYHIPGRFQRNILKIFFNFWLTSNIINHETFINISARAYPYRLHRTLCSKSRNRYYNSSDFVKEVNLPGLAWNTKWTIKISSRTHDTKSSCFWNYSKLHSTEDDLN